METHEQDHDRGRGARTREDRSRILPSAATLVLANLVPLYGVLALGWGIFPLVFLYWLENGIIGASTALKMMFSRSREPFKLVRKLYLTPLFCMHYGGFWAIHGIFVLSVFGGQAGGAGEVIEPAPGLVMDLIAKHGLEIAAISLMVSHGVSFLWNFLLKGEANRLYILELHTRPYARVVVLHVFIIFGGFLMLQLKSPMLGLLLLVALKTAVDLWAHSREHLKKRSKMHEHLKRTYEKIFEGEKGRGDSLVERHPGYQRDVDAEQRYRHTASTAGCLWLVTLAAGIGLLVAKLRVPGFALLGVSAVFLVAAIFLYNYRRNVGCRRCGRVMEIVETGAKPHELSRSERLSTLSPGARPKLRWFVCHDCGSYFLGSRRVE